jgi:hypothetical protein
VFVTYLVEVPRDRGGSISREVDTPPSDPVQRRQGGRAQRERALAAARTSGETPFGIVAVWSRAQGAGKA